MANGKLKVVVIVGPTGSGKTDLAVRLARIFHGECIAADSRTVYRGMDIGTAKPKSDYGLRTTDYGVDRMGSAYTVQGIPHHLLDVRNPDARYSVAEFKADAERLIEEITARGKLPIVVGGTGLYVQALVDNLTLPALPAQPRLRESFAHKPIRELLALLRKLDPKTARVIDRKNKRRVVRALEVCVFAGQPFSALRAKGTPKFDVLEVGVRRARTALYRRIDHRTRVMFRQGLVAEVQRLLVRYGSNVEPLRGMIYREVVEYLRGEGNPSLFHDREKVMGQHMRNMRNMRSETRIPRVLVQRIMYANHRYARHQLMWFKRDTRIHWVRTPRQAERLVREFLKTSDALPRGLGRRRGSRCPSFAS